MLVSIDVVIHGVNGREELLAFYLSGGLFQLLHGSSILSRDRGSAGRESGGSGQEGLVEGSEGWFTFCEVWAATHVTCGNTRVNERIGT